MRRRGAIREDLCAQCDQKFLTRLLVRIIIILVTRSLSLSLAPFLSICVGWEGKGGCIPIRPGSSYRTFLEFESSLITHTECLLFSLAKTCGLSPQTLDSIHHQFGRNKRTKCHLEKTDCVALCKGQENGSIPQQIERGRTCLSYAYSLLVFFGSQNPIVSCRFFSCYSSCRWGGWFLAGLRDIKNKVRPRVFHSDLVHSPSNRPSDRWLVLVPFKSRIFLPDKLFQTEELEFELAKQKSVETIK